MAASAPLRAQAAVPVTADIRGVVLAAGGDLSRARYDGGVLRVDGVSQAALDEAVAAYGDPSFGVRAARMQAAAAQMAARVAAGMPWAGKTLQIDEASQNRMAAMATAAQAGLLPPGFAWIMADNSPLPLDAAGMLQMAGAAGGYVYALRARYWALRTAILAAPDEVSAQAVDVSAGWPAPPASPG